MPTATASTPPTTSILKPRRDDARDTLLTLDEIRRLRGPELAMHVGICFKRFRWEWDASGESWNVYLAQGGEFATRWFEGAGQNGEDVTAARSQLWDRGLRPWPQSMEYAMAIRPEGWRFHTHEESRADGEEIQHQVTLAQTRESVAFWLQLPAGQTPSEADHATARCVVLLLMASRVGA